MNDKVITMAHGSGGSATSELIAEIFESSFGNKVLSQMEDSAVVPGSERIALTTDSFVVTPFEFPGGDIGRLCICGTVNDLLMRGAKPKYITCGFILQEGLEIEALKRVVKSMADTAKEAGVAIVAGDTKVVSGNGELFINTAGVGFIPNGLEVSAEQCENGDTIIVSGFLGDHHATILGSRMNITNEIRSDNAPLCDMVQNLIAGGIHVHTMRDVTRGGLATVLKELSESSNKRFTIYQNKIPVGKAVQDFCGILGLDPLYMGNEGKMIAIVPKAEAVKALEIIRNSSYGENAAIIGDVSDISKDGGELVMQTEIGGLRSLDVLQGEGLPRIC